MAKKRRSAKRGRDAHHPPIAKPRLVRVEPFYDYLPSDTLSPSWRDRTRSRLYDPRPPEPDFRLIQDDRYWNPDPAIARRLSGVPARLVVAKPSPRTRSRGLARSRPFLAHSGPPHRIAFEAPRGVLVCIRRKIRKQVLHAFQIAGRKGARNPPRRSLWSSIGC